MNKRKYERQLQQLDLAQRALTLQEQFSPERQARERLVQEQSRAAFYANEAFRREQQQLATQAPLRQRQFLAETQLAEDRARSFAPMQALTSSEQALRNATLAQELQFSQKTTEQRLREAEARASAATAGASSAQTEADLARRTLEPRVQSAVDLPLQTRQQNALQAAQLREAEQQMRERQQQMDQAEGLYPAQRLQGDVTALDALTQFASRAGPPVMAQDSKGKLMPVPGPADPTTFLADPSMQVYRDMLSRMRTAPLTDVAPGVQTTSQTLANPQLREGFLNAQIRNRPYTTTPEPGTVNRGAEITSLLSAMDANPSAQWRDTDYALQMIRQNPTAYGMYQFDPLQISPEVFQLALAAVRGGQYVAPELPVPQAVAPPPPSAATGITRWPTGGGYSFR